MRHSFSRLLPLLHWRSLRWELAIPALPFALWACNSHLLAQPLPNPQQETDFTILASPERQVDILFMVDNSPSMDPKQSRLAQNFPLMMQVLENLPDPTGGKSLPDVHIGVVDSDMGAGSGELGSNCSRVLGDKGLLWGNDPNNPIASVAANGASPQPNGCGLNSGERWIVDVANPAGGRTRNYTGNLADVFSCLARAVGVGGCGEEHQLQAVRVALNPQTLTNSAGAVTDQFNIANKGFLRGEAYLAIVIISDEDDCSADPSDPDGIFAQVNNGDTVSLRCAARGHICNGQPIPDYDPTNGYTGSGFSTDFSNCGPKDSDMTGPNGPLPLIKVSDIVGSVNYVKSRPQDQILVAGIVGWPPDSALTGVTVFDQYRIGKDSTWVGIGAQDATRWDYMPICEIPSIQSADGNIYKGYGGFRHKEFIDAFGSNGKLYSLCNSDFTGPMTQIGNKIATALTPGCVVYPLIDTDPNTPGTQPECQVTDRQPCAKPGQGSCLQSGYTETPLSECIDPTTGHPLDPTNPQLNNVPDSGRDCWYLYYDPNPVTGCPNAYKNQRIAALRQTGTQAPAGTLLSMKCLTCARADQNCPAL